MSSPTSSDPYISEGEPIEDNTGAGDCDLIVWNGGKYGEDCKGLPKDLDWSIDKSYRGVIDNSYRGVKYIPPGLTLGDTLREVDRDQNLSTYDGFMRDVLEKCSCLPPQSLSKVVQDLDNYRPISRSPADIIDKDLKSYLEDFAEASELFDESTAANVAETSELPTVSTAAKIPYKWCSYHVHLSTDGRAGTVHPPASTKCQSEGCPEPDLVYGQRWNHQTNTHKVECDEERADGDDGNDAFVLPPTCAGCDEGMDSRAYFKSLLTHKWWHAKLGRYDGSVELCSSSPEHTTSSTSTSASTPAGVKRKRCSSPPPSSMLFVPCEQCHSQSSSRLGDPC